VRYLAGSPVVSVHLASVHVVAGHLAAAEAPPSPLLPSVTEMIIGSIAFGIVFFMLYKVLMPRISKTLAERTDAIEGGLKRAEDAQAEAKQVLAQYKAQLDDARHEAARIREQAKEEAAQLVAKGRADGLAEKQRMIASASAEVEADRQRVLTALHAEVGTLAVELASRIVGESLADEARQSRMVDRFLAELDAQTADQVTGETPARAT
jgi:F-type H+-transporting ATPase subunit b